MVPVPDVTLLHQLAERLTAAGNYLAALRRRGATNPQTGGPEALEILERAIAQLEQAGELLRRLRQTRDPS